MREEKTLLANLDELEWVVQHDKMNDLKRPEVKVGRKEKDKCGEQLAERSIYLAEPEVCFWCFLPVKTLENWEPIYIYVYTIQPERV